MKKLLAMALALLMVAVLLPVTAMAENANYCTIEGITGEDGTTLKHFDTLTAAAKAWRESKSVVTSGSTFGMNSLGTVDSITWVVSGEVATGDGEGVIGNNGAGGSILGGGYFTPGVTVNNIIIKGVNDAKIAKTGDKYLVSAPGQNVVYENITFVDRVWIDSNPANLTFKNCKFEAGFRMPHSATNGNVTIENCIFTGNESNGYAIFAQGDMASFKINGNTISNCRRGINVQVGNNAVVTINGNTITNIIGKTANGFTYGEAIQLTSAKTFTVTNNTISDVAVNALHIWMSDDGNTKCDPDSITIKDNYIAADYLIWNDANLSQEKIISAGNTLDIKYSGKAMTKTGVIESSTTINGTMVEHPIIIYTPVSSPVFLSGANQTVAPGSAATFRIDKEFSELQSVAVDGVTLDKSNYKAWSGSTYVELTAAHMKTLAAGTHTLSVYFTGDTATTTFTISKDATKNPTTGANDFVGAAAALAVVSLLGMAVASRKK